MNGSGGAPVPNAWGERYIASIREWYENCARWERECLPPHLRAPVHSETRLRNLVGYWYDYDLLPSRSEIEGGLSRNRRRKVKCPPALPLAPWLLQLDLRCSESQQFIYEDDDGDRRHSKRHGFEIGTEISSGAEPAK